MQYTAKNQKLLKTGCNNIIGATLFNVVNNIVRHCYTWLRANSGSTILFNIVDNQEQCSPNNIVASCFQQPVTTYNFFPCRGNLSQTFATHCIVVVRSMRCAVHCFEQNFNSGSSFTGGFHRELYLYCIWWKHETAVFNFLLSVIPVVSLVHVLPSCLKLLIDKEIVADHSVRRL